MSKQVSAKIIADSVSKEGNRITTFELEYPRIIHSELMTHRLFSRNAASSRAIPVKTLIEMVRNEPAMPVRFGANQPGMQDKGEEHTALVLNHFSPPKAWAIAAEDAAFWADAFAEAGYHKQIANRLLEPFQRMKTVLTATEYENFWWLRLDKDADPTIEALGKAMYQVYTESDPEPLSPGQWHTPYVDHLVTITEYASEDNFEYCILDENNKPVILTEEEALSISASCCAQVSYRRLISTKDKALDIYSRLLSGDKVHASPFEHQSTPMQPYKEIENSDYLTIGHINKPTDPDTWEKGITHMDRQKNLWSGNFKGWIQHRQLLDNHTKW